MMTRGLELRDWQIAARDRWFASGRRGTMKVVTGAGKTVLALAIAERLQQTADSELRVAIVVPTVVLLDQWYRAIREHSDLPPALVGRLGDGHRDSFADGCRVLVCVLASARRSLPRLVAEAGVGEHLLLVVDECHRAGAPEQSAVLRTPRAYALGLSATPERLDDQEGPAEAGPSDDYDASLLGRELGGTVYELSVAEAARLGILPAFELHHFGLSLSEAERALYDDVSRQLSDLRARLAEFPGARRAGGGKALLAWCRKVAGRGDELGATASRFVGLTTARKRLLYGAENRRAAAIALVRDALAADPDTRIILFHESIAEVVALFEAMVAEGLPAVMEHSKLPGAARGASLELFRAGAAQVIVSARSLIEGFDVPAADLGIVVASSSSPRQRIQSIGRVLRKNPAKDGEDKLARICLLYMRDTADELIYEKADWAILTGAERNRYFAWDLPAAPLPQPQPPRRPPLNESEIDFSTLVVGDVYPGGYEGEEFSCDTRGNVTDSSGRVAKGAPNILSVLERVKGGAGRFRVTPRARALLVRVPVGEQWRTLYGGRLEHPLQFPDAGAVANTLADVANNAVPEANPVMPVGRRDISELRLGDPYPGPDAPVESYIFGRARGGVIQKRVPGGKLFASGPAAAHLIEDLLELSRSGVAVSKFFVNDQRHAFWREQGVPHFIAMLEGDLHFPTLGERPSGGSDA
ncbi:MAG TPA: DEAD/DEAH box helicase [Gemmatimonadales bacterium]